MGSDVDTRVGGVDTRVGGVDTRVGGVDTRVGGSDVAVRVASQVDEDDTFDKSDLVVVDSAVYTLTSVAELVVIFERMCSSVNVVIWGDTSCVVAGNVDLVVDDT